MIVVFCIFLGMDVIDGDVFMVFWVKFFWDVECGQYCVVDIDVFFIYIKDFVCFELFICFGYGVEDFREFLFDIVVLVII